MPGTTSDLWGLWRCTPRSLLGRMTTKGKSHIRCSRVLCSCAHDDDRRCLGPARTVPDYRGHPAFGAIDGRPRRRLATTLQVVPARDPAPPRMSLYDVLEDILPEACLVVAADGVALAVLGGNGAHVASSIICRGLPEAPVVSSTVDTLAAGTWAFPLAEVQRCSTLRPHRS